MRSNRDLTGTEILWEQNNPYQYKIETSKDNVTWKPAVDKTTNKGPSQLMSESFSDNARYIRITITGGTSTNNKAGFYEFRLFDGVNDHYQSGFGHHKLCEIVLNDI